MDIIDLSVENTTNDIGGFVLLSFSKFCASFFFKIRMHFVNDNFNTTMPPDFSHRNVKVYLT